jgi:uncharacterized paraquat-inducible protein A
MEQNEWARIEKELDELINDLQVKCDRYEKALKEIGALPTNSGTPLNWLMLATRTANEALSAGEDRICPNCNKIFNADRHGCCRECGSDEYNQKEGRQ